MDMELCSRCSKSLEHQYFGVNEFGELFRTCISCRLQIQEYQAQIPEARPALKRRRILRDIEAEDMPQRDNDPATVTDHEDSESLHSQNPLDAINVRTCTNCGFTGPERDWDRFRNGRFS